MTWLTGWPYRRSITITERSGSDLTDYQVKIELNSSNFDFSKANADGSDIRFAADDGTTLLPYWIEEWDSVNQTAKIWVKIPGLLANSSITIYMYYGNPDAQSESDGEAVFDFFDDFETWEGWTKYGGGVVSQSSEQARSGLFSAKKDSNADPDGAYKGLGFTLDYPFVLEAWINRTYFSGANSDRIGVIDQNGNGYGPHVTMSSPYVGIDKRDGYSGAANNKVTLTTGISNEWYKVKFYWNNGEMKAEVYDKYEAMSGSTTYTDTTYTSFARVYVFGGYTYFVDDIFIRKYADPEPTFTVSAEEAPIISGIVKLSDGTPVSGATVICIREDNYTIVGVTTSQTDGSYAVPAAGGVKNTVIVIPSDGTQNGDIKCHIVP